MCPKLGDKGKGCSFSPRRFIASARFRKSVRRRGNWKMGGNRSPPAKFGLSLLPSLPFAPKGANWPGKWPLGGRRRGDMFWGIWPSPSAGHLAAGHQMDGQNICSPRGMASGPGGLGSRQIRGGNGRGKGFAGTRGGGGRDQPFSPFFAGYSSKMTKKYYSRL